MKISDLMMEVIEDSRWVVLRKEVGLEQEQGQGAYPRSRVVAPVLEDVPYRSESGCGIEKVESSLYTLP